MEEGGKEVGGVGAVARAEVGHHNGNVGAHHGGCAGIAGWVGARGEGEGKGEGGQDRGRGDGDGGDRGGVGDRCRDRKGWRWGHGGRGDLEGGREVGRRGGESRKRCNGGVEICKIIIIFACK